MRIDERLAGAPVVSFQLSPPRSVEAEPARTTRGPGVHLHTLNRSPGTRAIVSALRAHGALPAAVAA
jgi:hypothetical protein